MQAQTTRHHFLFVRMAKKKKESIGEIWKNKRSHVRLAGHSLGQPSGARSRWMRRRKCWCACVLAVPLELHSSETFRVRGGGKHIKMFIAAFQGAGGKQPSCPVLGTEETDRMTRRVRTRQWYAQSGATKAPTKAKSPQQRGGASYAQD